MLTPEYLHQRISEKIQSIDFSGEPKELYEPIEYTLSLGGKRLRPFLVLMVCDLFDGNIDKAINSAIGIELFHNFTLLHDDIMDLAPLRRNSPTVYQKWNTNIAILSGDAMYAKAYELVIESNIEVLKKVLSIFTQTAIEVCEGQQYDMNYETVDKISIADYIKMIRLKTAVLIAASIKIGALVGGASDNDAKNLYKFGECIGIAFQLIDDYLDVYGNQAKFGKKPGGDILSNKKTFLLLKALETAKGSTLDRLILYTNGTNHNPEEKISAITEIYNELNIPELVNDLILEYFNAGKEYLYIVNISAEKKAYFLKFTEELLSRES